MGTEKKTKQDYYKKVLAKREALIAKADVPRLGTRSEKISTGKARARPGRNSSHKVKVSSEWLVSQFSPDFPWVYSQLLKQIGTGDTHAIKIWMEYCLGKPKQMVEMTGADGGPLQVQQIIGMVINDSYVPPSLPPSP